MTQFRVYDGCLSIAPVQCGLTLSFQGIDSSGSGGAKGCEWSLARVK